MDFRQKSQQLAMEYRDFWNERPGLAMAVGFVPVASTVVGIADAWAAHNDERADALERTLATAGIVPYGKVVSGLKKLATGVGSTGPMLGILTGPATLKRAREEGMEHTLTKTHYDPELGVDVQETIGAGTPAQHLIDYSSQAGKHRADIAGRAVVDEPLFDVLPEAKNAQVVFNPNGPAGSGSYSPGKGEGFSTGQMRLNTGAPQPRSTGVRKAQPGDNRGLVRDKNYYDDIRGVYTHEMGHGVQAFENQQGNFPANFTGADADKVGFFRYFFNPGELSAEADNLRKGWTREQLEELTPYQMRQAMRKKMEENIATGATPHNGMGALSNPAAARRYAEWAADEGIDPKMLERAREGSAVWKKVPRPKGGWHEMMTPEEIFNLEPRLGEKTYKMGKSGSWSVRKVDGRGPNYGQDMMFGKEIEPVRVKLRWNDDLGQLEAEDVDGVRRALHHRNLFGKDTKIPVVFEPVDDVAYTMSKDPDARKLIVPSVDIGMEDQMNFPDFNLDLGGMDY